MKVKFWGVRGSIPCPGPYTLKYGGNTPCIELRFSGLDRCVIIDAGTGIKGLGSYLARHKPVKGHIEAQIFLTHTHWDHIQGFPFFTPVYLPDSRLEVYGPVTYEEDTLKDILDGQWIYRYFPVRQAELAAQIKYINLREGRFDLGDTITLITKYLNHPLLCLAYRFEYNNKSFCTAYDTEPFQNLFDTDPRDPFYNPAMLREGERIARDENQRVEDFFAGADLLIHDAQYTHEEYVTTKLGWGHSPIDHAIAAAKRSGVKRLALFHHDPERTDSEIDLLVDKYCAPGYAGDTEVFFAREGTEIEI